MHIGTHVMRRQKASRTRAYRRRGTRSRRPRYSTRRRRIGAKKVSKTVIKGRGYPRDTTIVKLRYSTYVIFNTVGVPEANDGAAYYTFSGNDPVDPDFMQSTAMRPYYWDQFAGQYDKYRCLGSSIRATVQPYVQISNPAEAFSYVTIANFAVIPSIYSNAVTLITNQSEKPITNLEQLRSLPYCKSRFTSLSGTIKESRIAHYMPTGKLEGRQRAAILADPAYAANINASPSNNFYWHLFYWNPLASTNEGANSRALCRVDVTYYVKFEQRSMPAPSA